MTTIFSSPLPDASGSRRGAVSAGTQLFNGAKTFGSAITISKTPVNNEAALILPTPVNSGTYGNAGAIIWSGSNSYIRNTVQDFTVYGYNIPTNILSSLGASAADVAIKIGTSLQNSSLNTTAKLLAISTGIGGTEVERLAVLGSGLTNGFKIEGTGTSGFFAANNSVGTSVGWTTNCTLILDSSNATLTGYSSVVVKGAAGTSAADVVNKIGSSVADSSVDASAKLLSVRTGLTGSGIERLGITKNRLSLIGDNQTIHLVGNLAGGNASGVYATRPGGSVALIGGTGASRITWTSGTNLDLYIDSDANLVAGTGVGSTNLFSFGTQGTFRTLTGSATNTAIGPIGDDNTGIWYPAGDTINFVTAGNLRMQLTAGGTAAFQGPISMPTNSLFTIGSSGMSFYESSPGILTLTASVRLTGSMALSASENTDAISINNSARLHFGSGVNDYLYSNGTGIVSAGAFLAASFSGQNWSAYHSAGQMTITAGWALPAANPAFVVNSQTIYNGNAKPFIFHHGTRGSTGKTSLYIGVSGSGIVTGNDTIISNPSGTLMLASDAASGSLDIATKIGSSVPDASVNAATKLLSVRTGISGSETESVYVKKGNIIGGLADALTLGSVSIGVMLPYFVRSSAPLGLYAAGTSGLTETVRLVSSRGDSGLKCVTIGTESASPSDDTILAQFAKSINVGTATDAANGTALARVMASGMFNQNGTDSSASPGAATINKPTGISSIASGVSSVVITNSLATTTSRILITWLGDSGAARSWVTRAAGSFTVNLSANATADTPFAWEVSSIL